MKEKADIRGANAGQHELPTKGSSPDKTELELGMVSWDSWIHKTRSPGRPRWQIPDPTFAGGSFSGIPDLLVLSHLRWDFVYQRPQHLLSRCARERRVFFCEEPTFGDGPSRLHVANPGEGIWIIKPHLPHGLETEQIHEIQRRLLDDLMIQKRIQQFGLWYYTPMALRFTRHLEPMVVVFDCMDELSAFKFAPPEIRELELELLSRADVVFTGGQSLYEAKRHQHRNIHPLPSSVDKAHFARALSCESEPGDQAGIPHPRIGFFGVVDERMDLQLLDEVARARPDWHLVIIGPVVKIDPGTLPRHQNIHYLGGKSYDELPSYLAGWDVAMLPFARNESTRFISPTKTPEYLAAGRPVVSTSIRDVVRPYGEQGMVHIADTSEDFVGGIERALSEPWSERQPQVEAFLSRTSWDSTWQQMSQLIEAAVDARTDQLSTKSSGKPTRDVRGDGTDRNQEEGVRGVGAGP